MAGPRKSFGPSSNTSSIGALKGFAAGVDFNRLGSSDVPGVAGRLGFWGTVANGGLATPGFPMNGEDGRSMPGRAMGAANGPTA
jgi:hypothetical protein